jgi:hypothetical protein
MLLASILIFLYYSFWVLVKVHVKLMEDILLIIIFIIIIFS